MKPRRKSPPHYRDEVKDCFKLMSGRVEGYLFRYTQGNRDLARDLTQETFKRAWQEWRTVRRLPDDKRLAWLITVARNAAVDVSRRDDVARRHQQEVDEQIAGPESDVHTQALTAICIERFVEVVNAMPAQRSRVASLAWRSGWPGHAIAEALGITPSMVSQHLSAARRTLRKELGPYVPLESSDQEGATGS